MATRPPTVNELIALIEFGITNETDAKNLLADPETFTVAKNLPWRFEDNLKDANGNSIKDPRIAKVKGMSSEGFALARDLSSVDNPANPGTQIVHPTLANNHAKLICAAGRIVVWSGVNGNAQATRC
ncbi:hypothetical protein [Nevskia ramosa]|uniref:hypothetical protein n=1 Tax=Nevskia ramosa TaxID=64002 RepID=UPI0023521418|nr:hypothetical protein [Nevskia ramosa]